MINYGHTHEVYASEETDTGAVWLDGKPVYRQTVTFGAVSAGGQQGVSLGLGAGLDTVVSLRGMAVLADANYRCRWRSPTTPMPTGFRSMRQRPSPKSDCSRDRARGFPARLR